MNTTNMGLFSFDENPEYEDLYRIKRNREDILKAIHTVIKSNKYNDTDKVDMISGILEDFVPKEVFE